MFGYQDNNDADNLIEFLDNTQNLLSYEKDTSEGYLRKIFI